MCKFKVNNQKYTIIFDYPTDCENKAEIHYTDRCIVIEPKYKTHPKLLHLIIHEVTHAYVYETQVVKGLWNEESVCEFMAMYGPEIIKISKRILNSLTKIVK